MNIGTVLDRIVTLQQGLSITAPIAASVKRVHKFPPNRAQALADCPAWVNTWTMTRTDAQAGHWFEFYTVHCQLFVNDADLNRAADIATAFHVAFVIAMETDFRLSGTVLGVYPRGGDPTLALLEWAGQGYVGLDEFVDLEFPA